MHVEVLPLFGAGLRVALITFLRNLIFELFDVDSIVNDILEVTLRQDQHDGLGVFNFIDLGAPFSNVVEG